MAIFGINNLKGLKALLTKFLSNPVHVLLAAIVLYVAWNFYQSYEGFSSGKPTIILFHLPGCGYCEQMMPEWDKFQQKHSDDSNIVVKKVDGSKEAELAQSSGVNGFPTVIKYANGKKEVFEGERTAEALEGFISA